MNINLLVVFYSRDSVSWLPLLRFRWLLTFPQGFASSRVFFRMWRLSCLLIFQLHVRKPKSLEMSTQRGNRWCELAMSKAGGWLQKYGVPRDLYIYADLQEHEMTLLCFFSPPPFFFFFNSFPASFNCVRPFCCPVGCMFWMMRHLLLSHVTGFKDGSTNSIRRADKTSGNLWIQVWVIRRVDLKGQLY